MNVNRYIINYSKFVTQRIPTELRTPEVIAFFMVCVSPIALIYNLLIVFRDFALYNLSITPQVCYMEKMLNDRYDADQRRIYIKDGQSYDPLFIYQESELKPVFLYQESEVLKPKAYLYTEGEVGQVTNDFVVYVPLDIAFNETEMKTRINNFKLASKSYKIQTF